MGWKCNLKEKYYYCDSEYYIKGAVLAELLLDALIIVINVFLNKVIDFTVICAVIVIGPLVYFLYCFYKSYKTGKVKIEIDNGDILLHRLYLLKSYRIKEEDILDVETKETKRNTIIGIRTIKRKYVIKIYNA